MTVAPNLDTRFRLTESQARELAQRFGTPLYVLSEKGLRDRIRTYKSAFAAAAPKTELAFATKANSTLAVLAIAIQEGCVLDVASEGELRAALAASADPKRCTLHGNNKSRREIEFAIETGIGFIVIDNFREIETLSEVFKANKGKGLPKFQIRLAPGVDPHTHHKISTGQADTKFGFNIADGSAERAVQECLERGLPLAGFHCHVGSQLTDSGAQRAGAEIISTFAVEMKRKHGLVSEIINFGGGLGVHYVEGDQPLNLEDYNRQVVAAAQKALEGSGLDPTFVQEPGRSLVAEQGLTLYEVGVIKNIELGEGLRKTYACVNGGLADNPRPVMYGAKYTVERVAGGDDPGGESEVSATYAISGRHCETDLLFPDVALPMDLMEGDLLQVLCTGAYNASMASNYNRYQRPASVLIRDNGNFDLVQRPETFEEMLAREILPEGLRS